MNKRFQTNLKTNLKTKRFKTNLNLKTNLKTKDSKQI